MKISPDVDEVRVTSRRAERVVVVKPDVRLNFFVPQFFFAIGEVRWFVQARSVEETFVVNEGLVVFVSHLLN